MSTPAQLSSVDSPAFVEPPQFAADRAAARATLNRTPPGTPTRMRRAVAGGASPGSPGGAASPGSPATPRSADRFVPTRSAMDFDLSYHQLTNENLATNSLLEDDYSSGVE
jgi:hypothetical protein